MGLLNDATAQRNSVSARDGDYLRWQLGTVSGVLYADGSKNGVYYYRVIYYGRLLHHRRRGAVGGSVCAEVCAPGGPKQNERL